MVRNDAVPCYTCYMPAPLLPASTWTNPVAPPPLTHQPKNIRQLIRKLRTPPQVQRWLLTLKYNRHNTMHTIHSVTKRRRAHCLEAALTAAAILEHHGHPPLILDLDSADGLAHTLFLFRHQGKYGTVGLSRDVGLNGRKAVYKTIRSLVTSYAAPYIDAKARITSYGVLDLRTLKHDQWRRSGSHAWYVEKALRTMPHRKLHSSPKFIRYWRRRYRTFKQHHPDRQPSYYPNREHWM